MIDKWVNKAIKSMLKDKWKIDEQKNGTGWPKLNPDLVCEAQPNINQFI